MRERVCELFVVESERAIDGEGRVLTVVRALDSSDSVVSLAIVAD